jgi:hypothetical protein
MTTTGPDHRPCEIQVEYANGSWWAGCDCGWIAAQPFAREMTATDEWAAHVEQVTPCP